MKFNLMIRVPRSAEGHGAMSELNGPNHDQSIFNFSRTNGNLELIPNVKKDMDRNEDIRGPVDVLQSPGI